MSYISPNAVFPFLVKSNGTVALFVYLLIALSELRLRRRLERDSPERLVIRMWLFPWLTIVAIAAMLGILAAMAFIPDQRTPLIDRPRQPGDRGRLLLAPQRTGPTPPPRRARADLTGVVCALLALGR